MLYMIFKNGLNTMLLKNFDQTLLQKEKLIFKKLSHLFLWDKLFKIFWHGRKLMILY